MIANDIKILTSAEMYEADRKTIAAGTPGFTLMTRAGKAMAEIVAAEYNKGDFTSVIVLCGPGNNGGDGWVIGAELNNKEIPVGVFSPFDTKILKGDAKTAFEGFDGVLLNEATLINKDTIVVDALFGVGLERNIEGDLANLIAEVNARAGYIIAVDMPSGIHTDKGGVMGSAIKANETLTVQAMKIGQTINEGPSHSGEVSVLDIGIDLSVLNKE